MGMLLIGGEIEVSGLGSLRFLYQPVGPLENSVSTPRSHVPNYADIPEVSSPNYNQKTDYTKKNYEF